MPRWSNPPPVSAAPGFIEPCLPTPYHVPPAGRMWIHEIKHDGYRLLVRKREGKVSIYTRRGADWTHRFPLIVDGAMRLRAISFYIDGEGVVCREDGLAVFDRLHSKANDESCFLYAFDLIELDGADMRSLPLEDRKRKLRSLVGSRRSKIVYNDHMGGDGLAIFEHACKLGCEGIVSKRRDMAYRSGRSKSWLKIKNPKSPAMLRVEEGTF
jgi:bifunctional non-homologous end joining protein LigD